MAASKGSRVLSILERAKLVCWFEETNSYTQTARRYRTEFGMEPPPREQVKKWHDNFLSTGTISSKTNGGGTTAKSETGEGGGRKSKVDEEFEQQWKM